MKILEISGEIPTGFLQTILLYQENISLDVTVRPSLDKILVCGESPDQQLSPRSKIMLKVAATRKLCQVKKVCFL